MLIQEPLSRSDVFFFAQFPVNDFALRKIIYGVIHYVFQMCCVILSQYKVIDHKSSLSIYIIYEYTYAIGIFGSLIVLPVQNASTILIQKYFSRYLFQMEHEPAKFILSFPCNYRNEYIGKICKLTFGTILYSILK